eukprot:scaffold270_cov347-Pavlova_lutheri.AAC.6
MHALIPFVTGVCNLSRYHGLLVGDSDVYSTLSQTSDPFVSQIVSTGSGRCRHPNESVATEPHSTKPYRPQNEDRMSEMGQLYTRSYIVTETLGGRMRKVP